MGYWLFEKVVQEDDERTPQFALQSTSNWLRALQYEINMQHGSRPAEQLQSCIQVFASRAKVKGSQQSLAQIYEPLFYSLTFATSLASFARSIAGRPWVYPTAIVAWYYATSMPFGVSLPPTIGQSKILILLSAQRSTQVSGRSFRTH